MRLKSILASILSLAMIGESVQAVPYGSPVISPAIAVSIPSSLGYITDAYEKHISASAAPDMILIQNLHVNRSVQFAISGILKRLKAQGLMPDHIAMEGATGPIDIASMQHYPDAAVRKEAADYLVRQGEMPGAMHFAVTEGAGGLFGIETDEYYQANLEMFRRSYNGRTALRQELDKIQAVLPHLEKDSTLKSNALILKRDLEAVHTLINNEAAPHELPAVLNRASSAVEHLKLVLPQEASKQMLEPLSASINFYALALLRDEELFKNTLSVRELGQQKTTIVVTGGFHTEGLAAACKRRGLSYIVITPNVRRKDKIDQSLYIERLLDHHLTPEQVEQGLNLASMQTLEPLYHAASLFPYAISRIFRSRRNPILASVLLGLALLSPVQMMPQTRESADAAEKAPARPFHSLDDFVNFILEQRPRQPGQTEYGLPLTFRTPANIRMPPSFPEDPDGSLKELQVRKGAGLYDTALAIRALTDAGRYKEAKQIIEIYQDGMNFQMELRAYPNSNNTTELNPQGAFHPFSLEYNYFFDFTTADGIWPGKNWKFWAAHTGPNAHLMMSIAHYTKMSGDRSFVSFLRRLGKAMLLLRDSQTQGGIRFGPHGNYDGAAPHDPDYDFNRINSENEVSAYGALNDAAAVTGDAEFQDAAAGILHWLFEADVYNPKTGRMQKGMMDPESGLFYVDAHWNAKANRWEIVPELATDSGGTWAISSIGPGTFDKYRGQGHAYKMWMSLRSRMGWTNVWGRPGPQNAIASVDFKEGYPSEQALGTAEWTAGAVRAVEQLIAYYESGAGKVTLSANQMADLKKDVVSMRAWLYAHPNRYAEGPGMKPPRNGQTGWGWYSARGDAMAAGYIHFKGDPLAEARGATPLKIQALPVRRTQDVQTQSPKEEKPQDATAVAPRQTTVPQAQEKAGEEPVESSAFEAALYDHYDGSSWLGYFKKISKTDSRTVLAQDYLQYVFHANEVDTFKGMHIDVKGTDEVTVYGLFVKKVNGRWIRWLDNEKEDVDSSVSHAKVEYEHGRVTITIPMSEVKNSMKKADADEITQFHGQTGQQQNGVELNDKNSPASVRVKAYSTNKKTGRLTKPLPETSWNSLLQSRAARIAGVGILALSTVAWSSPRPSDGIILAAIFTAILVFAGILAMIVAKLTKKGSNHFSEKGISRREALFLLAGVSGAAIAALVWRQFSGPKISGEVPESALGNAEHPAFQATLYDHYPANTTQSWLGYFKKISHGDSQTVLDQDYLQYIFHPSDVENFKGMHIDVKGPDEVIVYGLYVKKINGSWIRWLEDEEKDKDSSVSHAKVLYEHGRVIVTIPMSEVKGSMKKSHADEITQFHGQTGQQQNGIELNDESKPASVQVKAFSARKSGASRRDFLGLGKVLGTGAAVTAVGLFSGFGPSTVTSMLGFLSFFILAAYTASNVVYLVFKVIQSSLDRYRGEYKTLVLLRDRLSHVNLKIQTTSAYLFAIPAGYILDAIIRKRVDEKLATLRNQAEVAMAA